MKNIKYVVKRMNHYLKYFEKNDLEGFIPFLKTYNFVTEKVEAKKKIKNYYSDPKSMELLDIYFANLYFKPLEKFIKENKTTKPWGKTFEYFQKDQIPMVQVLTGINVHINADLCVTLVDLNYKNRKDFMVINKILEEVIPEMMSYLAWEEHDIFGFGSFFMKRFVNYEFRKIVINWRINAWMNAEKLRKNPKLKTKLYNQTEKMSKDIIKLFHNPLNYLNPIKFFYKLNSMEVRI